MCYVYLIKSLLKYRKIEMCFEQCKKIMQVFSSIYPVFPFFYYYFFFVHFEIASARMYFVLFFFLFLNSFFLFLTYHVVFLVLQLVEIAHVCLYGFPFSK